MSKKATRIFIIGTFVTLYLLVSVISTIHVIDFFLMSNPKWLAVSLAIAFEVGAAASLASIITLEKMNKTIVWGLFILLTAMQAMGNTYYTYIHLQNFQGWIELFGLVDEDLIYQKRVLSIVSGAILPIIALGFIKALVDYIRPSEDSPMVSAIKPDSQLKSKEPLEEIAEKVKEELPTEEPVQEIEKADETLVEAVQPQAQLKADSKPVATAEDAKNSKHILGPDEAAARGIPLAGDRVVFSDRM